MINEIAESYNLDPALVYGVCKRESGLNKFAARYEPVYKYLYFPEKVKPENCSLATEIVFQKMSIGIMQVMGAVFREYGYSGWLSTIFPDLKTQLTYGCKHLSIKIKKYGITNGIAAYNSGYPRYIDNGILQNQKYVNDILIYAGEYKNVRLDDFI